MKTDMNSKQDVLVGGIIIFIIGLILILPMVNVENKDDENKKYVYYDVPRYTTVYDIIYSDSISSILINFVLFVKLIISFQ